MNIKRWCRIKVFWALVSNRFFPCTRPWPCQQELCCMLAEPLVLALMSNCPCELMVQTTVCPNRRGKRTTTILMSDWKSYSKQWRKWPFSYGEITRGDIMPLEFWLPMSVLLAKAVVWTLRFDTTIRMKMLLIGILLRSISASCCDLET